MVEPKFQILIRWLQLKAVEDWNINLSSEKADDWKHEQNGKILGALCVDLCRHPKQGQGGQETCCIWNVNLIIFSNVGASSHL